MTRNAQMPHVHELLALMESHPHAHIFAAALPKLIETGARAWGEYRAYGLEMRLSLVMNAVANELLKLSPDSSSEA